jgi:hypothetical protein
MYCFQNFLSAMSAVLNFQFFSGSSMRARKRFRFYPYGKTGFAPLLPCYRRERGVPLSYRRLA